MEKILRPDVKPSIPHNCSIQFCDPLNATGLIKRGLMVSSSHYPDNLYICKYGQVHECLPATCMAAEVCPVSGASYGVIEEYDFYDPDDARTWAKPGAPNNPTVKRTSAIDPYDRAFGMIDTILYSTHREHVHREWVTQQKKRAKKEKDHYAGECRTTHVPVNLIKLLMIESHAGSNSSGGLSILKRDVDVISRYAGYAVQVYRNVQTYVREKISIEAITLAVLYKMQQGMIVNDVTIIPLERFLLEHLPLINDLPKFKINKKLYTAGERLIFLMLENAHKQGKTDEELAIHEDLQNGEKLFKIGEHERV